MKKPDATTSCTVANVSRVLAEEPRLEAVAYQASSRKLAMATLGADAGARLAHRVSEAVHQPAGSRCGVVAANGVCAECGESVDARNSHPRVVVKQVMGNMLIEKQTCSTAIHFWQWQSLRWPKFIPRQAETEHDPDEWKMLTALAGGCLLASVGGLTAEALHLAPAVALACWAAAYLAGAWEAAEETWEKMREGALDVHFLMLAVAIGAAAIGAWHEGALLLLLFSASGAMEHYAMGRTQREIGALLRGAPKTATVLDPDGTERQAPVEDLQPGDLVRVTGGQQVPVDLRITHGESTCDESNLTGESRPVPKAIGDEAYSGTLNLNGVIEGRALRRAGESALQRVIALIGSAQKMRAPAQRFTDRFGTHYTYGVLALCAAMFFVWRFAFGLPAFVSAGGTTSAFYRAMTLLVVASPCALVLSIPSAILSAIAFGARRGLLFRGGAALEALATVDVVALDKTGTLTVGDLRLTQVEASTGTEQEARTMAYNLARFSDHPLSRAIVRMGQAGNLPRREPENFESIPGQGLRAVFNGRPYSLGKRAESVSTEIETYVSGPGLDGRLVFRDELRPEAAGLLERLRRGGLRPIMLTGDRAGTAQAIAAQLGALEVRAGLSPEQKLQAIEELKAGGTHRVAMVGDGVNDAPSLAAADVSVAMGARGSDAAMEQASVILMNDRLENLLMAFDLSHRTVAVIRQNLAVALGTVAVMVLASLWGRVPLGLGVAAHEGSTVLVVLNSLRLLFSSKSIPA